VDLPEAKARAADGWHLRRRAHLKDPRVILLLVAKGYMELQETLMQW